MYHTQPVMIANVSSMPPVKMKSARVKSLIFLLTANPPLIVGELLTRQPEKRKIEGGEMNGPITWDIIYWLLGFGAGVLGIWWRIERRIEKAETAAADAITKVEDIAETRNTARTDEIIAIGKDLADYKLHAAEQFASRDHLREVENRLAGAIDRLTNRVEQLPTRLAEEFGRIVAEAKLGRRA